MLYNNITEKILGMQDIEVKKVEENEKIHLKQMVLSIRNYIIIQNI